MGATGLSRRQSRPAKVSPASSGERAGNAATMVPSRVRPVATTPAGVVSKRSGSAAEAAATISRSRSVNRAEGGRGAMTCSARSRSGGSGVSGTARRSPVQSSPATASYGSFRASSRTSCPR
jgi:hypothetical protein